MTKRILLFIGFILAINAAIAKDLKAYQIYTKKGKAVDFQKLVASCEGKRYIFFGEFHNNSIAHWLQFELLRELHLLKKQHLILGAEMFESDNQFIIDEYLNDYISASSFQDEVRLWPNYNTDYKPLIEYAKANSLSFIATNIPRRYASMVYKKGLSSLENLSELAQSYIVPLDQFEFDENVTCYKELITSMGEHGGKELAIAQAIKDATMAYFIQKNMDAKKTLFHINGAYHSDNFQGIIHYLKPHIQENELLTISTVEQKNIYKLKNENIGIADFVICVSQHVTKTH